MIKYEDECVGCDLHCIGRACPYQNVRHLYCDHCGDEVDRLYLVDGDEVCADCAERLYNDESITESLEEIRYE